MGSDEQHTAIASTTQNRQKTIKYIYNVKSYSNTRPISNLEHIHDICMVRQSQIAGDEDNFTQHINCSHRTYKLVYCPIGIFFPYPGQQNRFRDKWRPILFSATKSHSRGYFMPCIRRDSFGVF